MLKKKELWLAFAGDDLTCSVAVSETSNRNYLEIKLSGLITEERIYIYDIIMDVAENSTYDSVRLDVIGLNFFTGCIVNDCAIEQLLKLVFYFSQSGKKLNILIEEECVKNALKLDLSGRRFSAVNISDCA
ncbi:MAG: hypothetical protein WCJ64_19570 [Rhodospirillaceae bacterium]